MAQLLNFNELEHLWISWHLDPYAWMYIPEIINSNMSIYAKHLHLTSQFQINDFLKTFLSRFKYLETLDIYDSFLFPQMTEFSHLLESLQSAPLRSISVKNPSFPENYATHELYASGLQTYDVYSLNFSDFHILDENNCQYLDFSYNNLHY